MSHGLIDLELPDETFVLWILLLVAIAIVTGSFVTAAFLLPDTVGALISGQALLGLGLGFVGSFLVLLVMVPSSASTDRRQAPEKGLTVRRMPAAAKRTVAQLEADVDRSVFVPGVLGSLLVVGALFAVPDRTEAAIATVEGLVLDTGRPVLFAAVFAFVAFAVVLAIGPWGRIRLGEDPPAYSLGTYVAMLFSAGIAAGIVFWGPAEALLHYETVPPYLSVAPESEGAIVGALQYTVFHWGLSAWATYLVVGLPIAYAAYNMGAEMRVSAVLVPILGRDAVQRPIGRLLDVLAVVATLGGLSTTLGFVSAQFLAGIEFGWGIGVGPAGTVLLVLGLTIVFVVAAIAGIRRGMRRLSLLNVGVFCGLVGLLFLLGPTRFVLATGADALSGYAAEFASMSLYVGEGGDDWLSGWTAFYWAWWLSWAPFVGLFLARISAGRRLRTVVLATVGATSLGTIAWFVVVGSVSTWLQHTGTVDLLAVAETESIAAVGYPLFEALPFGGLLLAPFLLLVITFVVTSADAATRSLAIVTTGRERPSKALLGVFGVLIGTIATLLIIFGGQDTLESAAIVTGGPFAVVGIVAIVGLAIAIGNDREKPSD